MNKHVYGRIGLYSACILSILG